MLKLFFVCANVLIRSPDQLKDDTGEVENHNIY